ncbi:hypothetical protein CMI45_01010 [Candidatus Pacearchaeota archaeon]|nr:hypothetical protein [Candidatus Pacearchaeota archaeon]|tara:strand:+ start:1270 stop:1755 length:486 start_codon:yes stop_codon:yes gene_type:complete
MVENIHKEFIDSLIEAEKAWQSGDHLTYVTYPVVKDDKLLLRALENLYESVVKTISTVLRFEYLYKRIELSKDSKRNLEMFFKKCGGRYGLGAEEREIIKEIIFFGKKHKEASVEFSGKGKSYIIDDDLGKIELDVVKLKSFLEISRKLLENANRNFKEIF